MINPAIEKCEFRITLAKHLRQEMLKYPKGTVSVNDTIMIYYEDGIVSHFTNNEQSYDLTKESFQKILRMDNIEVSVMLEQVFRASKRANE